MRTQTVNIDQAKNQLAELIAWAAEGGEILIVDNGKALARLVPPGETAAYHAHPPTASEFSSDEDSLSWDADGWENVARNAARFNLLLTAFPTNLFASHRGARC